MRELELDMWVYYQDVLITLAIMLLAVLHVIGFERAGRKTLQAGLTPSPPPSPPRKKTLWQYVREALLAAVMSPIWYFTAVLAMFLLALLVICAAVP